MSEIAGNGCARIVPDEDRKPNSEVERSINKKFRKTIWSKFINAIKDYKLVEEGDKIAVAISGGKDSLLMAKLFQELKRHGKVNFELEFIAMDPGYHEHIRALLIENCEHLNIPVNIFDSKIFEVVDKISKEYPCYLCAKMRRGALYSKAQELGCNKLALGHHFNDAIETTMLNMLYTGCIKTMMPRLKSTNFKNMELIRPLYYIEEKEILHFTKFNGIWPLNCACMVSAGKIANKRYELKEWIEELNGKIDRVDMNIMKAIQNVNMDCIIGWQRYGKKHNFLDFYDDEDEVLGEESSVLKEESGASIDLKDVSRDEKSNPRVIDQHFIFNSLNSLYYTAGVNPTKTQELILDLSDYLRAELDDNFETSSWEVGREVELINAYLNLQKTRHGNRLRYMVSSDIDDSLMISSGSVYRNVESYFKNCIEKKLSSINISIEFLIRDDLGYAIIEDSVSEYKKEIFFEDIENLISL